MLTPKSVRNRENKVHDIMFLAEKILEEKRVRGQILLRTINDKTMWKAGIYRIKQEKSISFHAVL